MRRCLCVYVGEVNLGRKSVFSGCQGSFEGRVSCKKGEYVIFEVC